MLDALTKSGSTNSSSLKRPNSFKIYPNPAKDELFFSAINHNGTNRIDIRDITGNLIKSIDNKAVSSETCRIDIAGMKKGMYLLSVTNGEKTVTGKFLVE